MEYLAKMKAKMAGLAEMQEVAARQAAIADNVKMRMAKINALLEGDVESTSAYSSGGQAGLGIQNRTSKSHMSRSAGNGVSENTNPETQGMTPKEEEEYWRRKIAMLSQPVTAQGLGDGSGTITTTSSYNSNIAAARPDSGRATNTTNSSYYASANTSSSSYSSHRARPNGVLARAVASRSPAGSKYEHSTLPSPLSNRSLPHHQSMRSPASRSHANYGFKASDERSSSPAQSSASRFRSPATNRSHSGRAVSDAPEGFPATPPGWARARDTKSGRFYLYNAKGETRWETDRQGRLYKK